MPLTLDSIPYDVVNDERLTHVCNDSKSARTPQRDEDTTIPNCQSPQYRHNNTSVVSTRGSNDPKNLVFDEDVLAQSDPAAMHS